MRRVAESLRTSWWIAAIFSAACLAVTAKPAPLHAGQFQEGFESPERTWQLAETDCRPWRILTHERRFQGAHSGRGSEFLQWNAGMGTYAYLVHPIQPARIIQELAPSVWVKSERHGIQLMARVVYPRTLEQGRPVSSFLFGDRYEEAGSWRQLRLDDVVTKLRRETVALRTRKGSALDEREAYIDLLVLNIYTGLGSTSLQIDDLEVAGLSEAITGDGQTVPISALARPEPDVVTGAGTEQGSPSVATTGGRVSGATLDGNLLLADGRPMFVRAVEHRGETLTFLQSLGFNAVRLATVPTVAQIAEADRCGIWLIAPPPLGSLAEMGERPSERILAWYLGEQLSAAELPAFRERLKLLEQEDRTPPRPLVASFHATRPEWVPAHCVPIWERPVLQTSFELQDFVDWLGKVSRESRSPAPFWVGLPTEPAAPLAEQIARLGGRPPQVDLDGLRWLAFGAVAAGARGVWYHSSARLDGTDEACRWRVAAVRQLNRELELIAPWGAGGKPLGEQEPNHPHVRAFALQTDRARLLILLRRTAEQQFVPAPAEQQSLLLALPSLPVTDRTYLVGPAGVDAVPTSRGGGVRLTMPIGSVVSLALLTSDPLAVNYLGRTAATIRKDISHDRLTLAKGLWEETQAVEEQLTDHNDQSGRTPTQLHEIRVLLRQAELLDETGDYGGALRTIDLAWNRLRQIRRSRWERTVAAFTSPLASPVCAGYSSLPAHFQLSSRLRTATWGVNVLAAGEMESLEHLLQSGWKQERSNLTFTEADVQLSLDQARGGRSALQLRAWKSEEVPTETLSEYPLTIISSPIQVQAGQLVRARVWVLVPRPLEPRWEGLVIFDDHTGPDLAERVTETQGWREVTLYRVATRSGEWRLHFALSGRGEAWIDDVAVTTLESP